MTIRTPPSGIAPGGLSGNDLIASYYTLSGDRLKSTLPLQHLAVSSAFDYWMLYEKRLFKQSPPGRRLDTRPGFPWKREWQPLRRPDLQRSA